MNKMIEDGGLATDGMAVDPVSGNDIPIGSNAEEVRDDMDSSLSSGEYVVPADVVKFFGVAYFEKLRDKAKSGLEAMDEDGRIGGGKGDYAEGGMVEGADIDSIVTRVKAAAEADPSVINILKSKGIYMQAPQVGKPAAPAASPANIATQDQPPGFADGGFAEGSNPRSNFNKDDYGMGFSIKAPQASAPSTGVAPTPVCPEGYALDPVTKVCMPVAVAPAQIATPSTTSSRSSGGGSTTSNRPNPNSNSWMEKYNYNEPEKLFQQSMEAVATSASVQGEEGEEMGLMGRMGQSFLSGNGLLGGLASGLAGGVLGKFMSATNSAQVSANVQALEAMGRQDLADQLKTQVGLYDNESGLPDMLETFYDGSSLFENLQQEKGDLLTQRAPDTAAQTGTSARQTGSGGSAQPTAQAPLVSPRPQSRNDDNARKRERSVEGRVAAEDKAMASTSIKRDTSNTGGGSGSLVTGGPSTVATTSQRKASEQRMASDAGSVQKDDGSYDISSWNSGQARGGLMRKATKKKKK